MERDSDRQSLAGFQFWKLLAVVLDTHIKSVDKVHRRSDSALVMLPLI